MGVRQRITRLDCMGFSVPRLFLVVSAVGKLNHAHASK